jgi:hypothetical protein
MSAAAQFHDAIKAVGGTAYLIRDGEKFPFPASIQPRLTGDGLSSAPLGLGAERLYNLYAADISLAPGDTVEYNSHPYYVTRADPHTLRGAALYTHAILRKGATT